MSHPVVQLILKGVCLFLPEPSLTVTPCHRNVEQMQAARELVADYIKAGAVQPVAMEGTRYLIPWFIVSKPEGNQIKHRLISDCRVLNKFLTPKTFRLDHWKDTFPF